MALRLFCFEFVTCSVSLQGENLESSLKDNILKFCVDVTLIKAYFNSETTRTFD
jgi:hypothetical protein